jgi:hypothetical protein
MYAHIPYVFACHLQIDADPDPAYHFDADPDFYMMRIQVTKMMWIRIHNTAYNSRSYQNDADTCGSGSGCGSTTLLTTAVLSVIMQRKHGIQITTVVS